MPNWYQTRFKDRYDKAADGTEFWYIGGESISFIKLTMQVDAVTDIPTVNQLSEVINSIQIKKNGDPIFDFPTGADFPPMMVYANRKWPFIHELSITDPSNTTMVVTIPFGRYPFDPDFGLNKTDKDDIWIEIAIDDADTNVDNPRWHLDVFYTPDKVYKGVRSITSKTVTQAAAGPDFFDIPRKGHLLGIGFFGTTVALCSADTSTIDNVTLYVDNKVQFYQNIRWATFYGMMLNEIGGNLPNFEHVHADPSSGTTGSEQNLSEPYETYAYLPLEWDLKTGTGLNLKALKTMQAYITAGDTNAARMFPDILNVD
jgi:hypothetical protein